MPISSVEIQPQVSPPLESKPQLDGSKLQSIQQITTQVTGEQPTLPIDTNSKIVIEVAQPPAAAQPVTPAAASTPGFFSHLAENWEKFTNWRRTFLMNRFGTTRSKQGLNASLERAVDKAEEQGQQVTSVQK